MKERIVRLTKISMQNFKNVENGEIVFPQNDTGNSVLGVFGPNGSGKTALIDAITFFKLLVEGTKFSNSIFSLINVQITLEWSACSGGTAHPFHFKRRETPL